MLLLVAFLGKRKMMKIGIRQDVQRWLDAQGDSVDPLADRLASWALSHMDEVLEQGLIEFMEEHGRYPRYGWIDLGLSDDFESFTITAFMSDIYPESVPAFTPIIDFSALVDAIAEA